VLNVYEPTFRRNVSPPSSGSKINVARHQSTSWWLPRWFPARLIYILEGGGDTFLRTGSPYGQQSAISQNIAILNTGRVPPYVTVTDRYFLHISLFKICSFVLFFEEHVIDFSSQ
jgi:hypothetical protein